MTGTRSLVARYLGDAQNPPAASNPVNVTVNTLPASGFNSSNLDMGIAIASAAAGDFNNDGRADIVAVGSSNIVKVALGNGDGTFAAPIGTIVPLHASLLSLVVGDFNQDGYEDIALSDVSGNSVAVIFGNGDGTFGTSVLLPTAAGQIVVADFNADGFPDLAVLHRSSNSVGILLGSANGTFGTPTEFPFAPYLYNMIAGDVNNDGNVDLLTVVSPEQNDSREVVVLLGDGTGGFSAQINGSSFAFFYNPWDSYALEDLNGDGKPDLVLAPGWGYQIGIFPGNGDGTFGQPTYYPISNDFQYTGGAYGISVVDFNGDGMPDVLSERGINSSGQPRKSLDLYAGNGDGTVQPLWLRCAGSSAYPGRPATRSSRATNSAVWKASVTERAGRSATPTSCRNRWKPPSWRPNARSRTGARGRSASAWCGYPLTVTDHASRYLLLCEALESNREELAFRAFERLFRERGLPQAIRSDNGVPFASPNGLFNLSRLSVWWLRLGIRIERIRPGHPQQNGRHERMHLTLKREATRPAGQNILQQQAKFDGFVEEFNTERPHQALQMQCPAEVYIPSLRPYQGIPEPHYPFHDRTVMVTSCGRMCLYRKKINLSKSLAGQAVGVKEVDSGIWLVSFIDYDLGYIDLEERTLQPLENPFGAKVLPMS